MSKEKNRRITISVKEEKALRLERLAQKQGKSLGNYTSDTYDAAIDDAALDVLEKSGRVTDIKALKSDIKEPTRPAVSPRSGYKYDKFMIPIGNTIGYGQYELRPSEMWRKDCKRVVGEDKDGFNIMEYDKDYKPWLLPSCYKPEYLPDGSYYHKGMSRVWWCPPHKMDYVKSLCEPWENNGFKLNVGVYGGGTATVPHVIETFEQQRGVNMFKSVNRKGVPALIGDTRVWLTIEDDDKAWAYLQLHSDIPVALVCDIARYNDSDVYRQAYDVANEYFMCFFENGIGITPVAKRPLRHIAGTGKPTGESR